MTIELGFALLNGIKFGIEYVGVDEDTERVIIVKSDDVDGIYEDEEEEDLSHLVVIDLLIFRLLIFFYRD